MVKEAIVAIFNKNKKRYGYRRITQELHNNDICVNHKTVQKLMKQLGLVCQGRAKRKYNSSKGEVGEVAPNLLERRGRACAASGTRKGRKPKLDKQVEEDLIAENQRLRMEIDYLKKLRALVLEEERQNRKHK